MLVNLELLFRLFASLWWEGLRCFRRTEMLYYLIAAGLVAHTFFWGFGLAKLALPPMWRRWAWVFAPGFGFALQSAVVWVGAHTSLAGTNVYAWWSEVLPGLLLIGSVLRTPRRGWLPPLGLALLALVAGWFLLSPMTQPGRGLTSSSLGNCDQADYAAGARVFQEFSRDDRTGFMGLTEVTKVRSADYFFDFWVRLNHFTPSALVAHNAAIFAVESFRVVSIAAVALVLLNLPLVFFLGRQAVGLRGIWLLGLVALYAFSPLTVYAVYHGQLGQLYAAQGIALLTVAVFGASQVAHSWARVMAFLPLLLAGFWLLAGSYNFILPVCLAPAGAWLLARLWQRRDWRGTGRVVAALALALGLCALLFWGRFDGLIERFSLFQQYDFGWPVALFSPEGVLGMLGDTSLNARSLGFRVGASIVVVGLWLAGLILLWRRNSRRAFAALALVIPVMFGWGMLAWETRVRANASYDAYKLISVFLPGLLAGLVSWLAAIRRREWGAQVWAFSGLMVILTINVLLDGQFRRSMSNPPLRVSRNIIELGLLEKDSRFASFNMTVEDYWSRIWANAFLLRKPQYFTTHTYEGRLNTELKGEWNLSDSLLHPVPLQGEDYHQFNVRFFLTRVSAPGLLDLGFADGWYAEEESRPRRWRWSNGQGRIRLMNPAIVPLRVRLRMSLQSLLTRNVTVRLDARVLGAKTLDGSIQMLEFDNVLLPPGQSMLTLSGEAASPGGGDGRLLAFALYGFDVRALSLEK